MNSLSRCVSHMKGRFVERGQRALAWILVLLTGSASAACFGRFQVTSAVYHFNRGASSSPVVRSLLMWALLLIPVYAVAGLADVFIFNVIEFFEGGGSQRAQSLPDGSELEMERVGPELVRVRHRLADGHLEEWEVAMAGTGAATLRRPDGTVLATAETLADGSVHLRQ